MLQAGGRFRFPAESASGALPWPEGLAAQITSSADGCDWRLVCRAVRPPPWPPRPISSSNSMIAGSSRAASPVAAISFYRWPDIIGDGQSRPPSAVQRSQLLRRSRRLRRTSRPRLQIRPPADQGRSRAGKPGRLPAARQSGIVPSLHFPQTPLASHHLMGRPSAPSITYCNKFSRCVTPAAPRSRWRSSSSISPGSHHRVRDFLAQQLPVALTQPVWNACRTALSVMPSSCCNALPATGDLVRR